MKHTTWFKEKIKKISCTWGNRTAPLNFGFEHSSGEYLSIIDDDDIVLDHWVETFMDLAKDNFGAVLHAYCALQDWVLINPENDNQFLRATGTPSDVYCTDYKHIEQLNRNLCPLLSLAFPSFLYKKFNIQFDETLSTTEDWDYLLRATQFCGIVDAPIVTSIYRKWVNAENSNTLHDQVEWKVNHKKIQNKLNNVPLLFPSGTAQQIIELLETREFAPSILGVKPYCTVYLNYGSGYSEETAIKQTYKDCYFEFDFPNLSELGQLQNIRFDPSENGMVDIKDLEILVKYSDGYFEQINLEEANTNGILIKNNLVFLKSDPQIEVPVISGKHVSTLAIKGHISFQISDERIDEILRFSKTFSKNEDGKTKSDHLPKNRSLLSRILKNNAK